jgi:hypothetical protein
MTINPRTERAIALMMEFARRTGLTGPAPQRRYLWTDAFAVCNFLGLACDTGEPRYLQLALDLVDRVHHSLGRQRENSGLHGWLSGLSEQEGEAHPTLGGLRIGKKLPERRPDEPFDEQLEWDRDGQYFHYLTKWMHALDQVSRAAGQRQLNLWARELAQTAFRAFSDTPPAGKPRAMHWKMSIDLSRPLVPSMGQHDPLDGYITCLQLRATAAHFGSSSGPSLDEETAAFAQMLTGVSLGTADPLGIGGLLIDAYRLQQLMMKETASDGALLEALLSTALAGAEYYARSEELRAPAAYRLGFRELGLAIGLHAMQLLWLDADRQEADAGIDNGVRERLRSLLTFASLGDDIESFWSDPEHQQAPSWGEHLDINEVMLATSLAPEGFLVLDADSG